MRWAVFYTMRPEGKNPRNRVGRWAKVLCHFRDIGLPVRSVVPRLKDGGGVKGCVHDILGKNSGAKGSKATGFGKLSPGDVSDDQDNIGWGNGRIARDLDVDDDAPSDDQDSGESRTSPKKIPRRPARRRCRLLEIATRSRAQERRALTPGKIVIWADVTEGKGDWKDIKATKIRKAR